jgi:hypothetical protein
MESGANWNKHHAGLIDSVIICYYMMAIMAGYCFLWCSSVLLRSPTLWGIA